MDQTKSTDLDCPESPAALRQRLREQVERIADFCQSSDGRFCAFAKELRERVWELARLFISLFLAARQQRLQQADQDYPG
jgi:hypothetical protein